MRTSSRSPSFLSQAESPSARSSASEVESYANRREERREPGGTPSQGCRRTNDPLRRPHNKRRRVSSTGRPQSTSLDRTYPPPKRQQTVAAHDLTGGILGTFYHSQEATQEVKTNKDADRSDADRSDADRSDADRSDADRSDADRSDADRSDADASDHGAADDPVAFWASTRRWPTNFAAMSQGQSSRGRSSSKKRPLSSSYAQSFRDGEVPRAHSRAYEQVLALHGVYMDQLKGQSLLSEGSKALCATLLQVSYPEPEYTPYPLSKFPQVWQRVQSRNEARLFRDITPLLVPSPELLHWCGHEELEHIAEELDVEWTKCKTLGGPSPKPDQTIGLAQSAFDADELAKLDNYTSFEHATRFGEHVYFPFLLVEVKCAIERADRQNMHSSSIAANAIIRLYSTLDRGRAVELNGEVLLFSISHDDERVKLFAHFAVVDGDIAFYRYPIEDYAFNLTNPQGRKKTRDFVRAVYDRFYPVHLARIRRALAALPDPRTLSMTSTMSLDETDPQEVAVSALSSQETARFKKPTAPASNRQRSEVALLREQLVEQQKQSREQLDLLKRQLEEEGEKQRREGEERKELLELLELLKQQGRQLQKLVKEQ